MMGFHVYSQTSSTEFHPRAPKGHEFHLKDKNLISYDFMAFCGSRSGIVRGTLARPKIIAKSTIFNRNFILKKSASTFWICWWLLIYFIRIAKPQTLNFILEHLRAMNFIWRTRIWFHMIYMISWHSVAPGAALWGEPLPGPKSLPNQQFLVGTLYKKMASTFWICWWLMMGFHVYSQTSSTEFHPRAPKGHEFHLKDTNLISYDFMAFCGSRSGIVRGTLARPKIIAKSTIFSGNFIQKKWQVLFEFVDGWWWVFMCIAKPQALNFILEHLRAMNIMNFIWRT